MQITEQIYVGSCIQTEEDVKTLSTTASTIEAANWGIDSNLMNESCQKFNVLMVNNPIRDADSFDMRKKLPFCVGVLLRLLKKNHRVYVTCTTGFDRSPACVIAYLHWMTDTSLHAAYNFVTGLHSCKPDSVEGRYGYIIKEKLKMLKKELKVWNATSFGNLDENIERRKKELKELDDLDEDRGLIDAEIIRRNEVKAPLIRETKNRAILLSQKARYKWLKEGDANSSYFHKVINGKRKATEISGIKIDEVWTDGVEEVKTGVKRIFEEHFKSRTFIRPIMGNNLFEERISEEENQYLTAPFSESEVFEALSLCDSSKSPGPDDFNFLFLKESWLFMKEEIMKFFEEFHKNKKLIRGLNQTFITLIPKKEASMTVSDYRPISLVGCIYKLLSKVLARRLSKVLC
ncbi:hypothetical protein OROMI_032456 [Orobanche minor]